MNRSLVLCLALSTATALAASVAALSAGWGWLPALAVYSGVGSTSLVACAALLAWASDLVASAAPARRSDKQPAFV